jgi:aryl-alcohol dehydrogenase-like predicted oxidoreductase
LCLSLSQGAKRKPVTHGQMAVGRGVSYPQVALLWLRAKIAVSSVILGARTVNQLKDNLGSAEIDLTQEVLHLLSAASHLPELYPYSMIYMGNATFRRGLFYAFY